MGRGRFLTPSRLHNLVFALRLSWETSTVPPMAFDRIKVDPNLCGGRPTIRGLRITVDFVLKLLGDGYTADQITREYPELEIEDVYQFRSRNH